MDGVSLASFSYDLGIGLAQASGEEATAESGAAEFSDVETSEDLSNNRRLSGRALDNNFSPQTNEVKFLPQTSRVFLPRFTRLCGLASMQDGRSDGRTSV